MEMITVRMPEWMVGALDELVRKGLFATRSEAIRAAVRDYLRGMQGWKFDVWSTENPTQITKEEEWEEDKG